MKINIGSLDEYVSDIDSSSGSAEYIINKIVNSYTKDLDDIMRRINESIINTNNPPSTIVESFFIELTNAYYFIAPRCELLGLKSDIAKASYKAKYDKIYSDTKLEKPKATIDDLKVAAEMEAQGESVTDFVYSRSYSMIKRKLEAANTMIATLSKIITTHDTERKLTGVVNI